MRLQLLGLSAILLSGCAWMDSGPAYHHSGHHNVYQAGYAYNYNQHQRHHRAAPKRTHLDFSAGAEAFTGGNVLALRNQQGNLTTNKIAYKDAYNTGWRASAGIAHDVAPRTTLTFDGFYKEADAKSDIFELVPNTGGTPVYGSFSDYKSYGAEIGFREYANNYGSARPYIGATVGASYVEDISLDRLSTNRDPNATASVMLYEGEWVPTASGLVGIDFPVSHTGTLSLETGLRYEGKRENQLSQVKDDDVYSVPLRLRGRFRFYGAAHGQ